MDKKLSDALVYVQSGLKAPKENVNSFGKYKYRSCEDILEAVKPHLKATNTTLTISDDLVLIGDRYYVKATALLSDGEHGISSTAFAREPEKAPGANDSQITGSASSYARKYALNGLFAIDDTKDADATNTHDDKKSVLTENQKEMILRLGQGKNIDTLRNMLKEEYGVNSSSELTMDQASHFIEYLRGIK